MKPTALSERWSDGTEWTLALPEGWTQVLGRKLITLRAEASNHELSFGVRKALAETREESSLEAVRSIAMRELLSSRRDAAPATPLARKWLAASARALHAAGPLRRLSVYAWCRVTGARIVAVNAGALAGHVLESTDGETVRSRGYLRFADWRIYVEMLRSANEADTPKASGLDVLSRLKFHARTVAT